VRIRKLLLTLAAIVYASWLALLTWLVWISQGTVIVSRPQLWQAPVIVQAYIEQNDHRPSDMVLVERIFRGAGVLARHHPGTQAAPLAMRIRDLPLARGWRGPGSYILALRAAGEESWEMVAVPESPGFAPAAESPLAKPRIYPATPGVIAQVETALQLLAEPETIPEQPK